MEVILKEDFPSLGYVGDRVSVRGGYARNYLIPRGVALEASARSERLLNHKLTAIHAKRVKLRGQAQEIATKLEAVKLEFKLKLGAGGKSFGSITTRDLLPALEKEGFQLDRKQLRITEVIRGAGEYTAEVKLHSEVIAKVTLTVIAERPVKEAKEASGDERKGRSRRRSKDASEEQAAAAEVAPAPETDVDAESAE